MREGTAVTVLAYGTMVHVSLRAVEEAGIDAEVIDLRSIVPLDIERSSPRSKRPDVASSCMRPRACRLRR